MHFHVLRPLHGWREFAGEMGTIVLGVLIGLGAEQAIKGIHDRAVTSQGRRDVREELATGLGFYAQRLQELPCIDSKLDEMSKIVESGIVQKDAVRWVGRTADLARFTERWGAVTSRARTALFRSMEQSRLDPVYGIFGALAEESHNEERAWGDLASWTGCMVHLMPKLVSCFVQRWSRRVGPTLSFGLQAITAIPRSRIEEYAECGDGAASRRLALYLSAALHRSCTR